MTSAESRRRFPRLPAQLAVLVRPLDASDREALSSTRVMGLGGCMFTSDESLGTENLIRVLITVQHEVVEAVARVAYERPRDDGRFEIGVEFLVMSDEDASRIASLFPGTAEDWEPEP